MLIGTELSLLSLRTVLTSHNLSSTCAVKLELKMGARRKGSSPCIEFFVSLVVGGMAIIGGLCIVGFLLVEPVRQPPGQRTQTIGEFIAIIICYARSIIIIATV